jgi:hypothetical protein
MMQHATFGYTVIFWLNIGSWRLLAVIQILWNVFMNTSCLSIEIFHALSTDIILKQTSQESELLPKLFTILILTKLLQHTYTQVIMY